MGIVCPPTATLCQPPYFSPPTKMLSAVEVAWLDVSPQTTPVPHTTLKPALVLEPQQTPLPHSTAVPFTKTFVPQTREVAQDEESPQTTPCPVTRYTLCVEVSKTAA